MFVCSWLRLLQCGMLTPIPLSWLQSVADCDLNPLTRNYLASPAASASIKMLALKMIVVITSACLDELPKVQPVVMLVCVVLVTYLMLISVSGSLLLRQTAGHHMQAWLYRGTSTTPSWYYMLHSNMSSTMLVLYVSTSSNYFAALLYTLVYTAFGTLRPTAQPCTSTYARIRYSDSC